MERNRYNDDTTFGVPMEKRFDLDDYPFEVFKYEDEGVADFLVRYKDVPTAMGSAKSQKEAIALARESLETVLEDLQERGEPIPKPTIRSLAEEEATGRITFRMPKSLHCKLIERSQRDGVSLNTSILVALSAYLAIKERETLPFHSKESQEKEKGTL